MCPPKPKTPKVPEVEIPEPAPAPPPPEPTAEAPVVEGGGRTAAQSAGSAAKRKGTSSLRIDVNLAQPGGQGVNVPRG